MAQPGASPSTGIKTLAGYRELVAAKLELVLSDPEPTAEEARALRRAFASHLISVDEGARRRRSPVRQCAALSLPQSAGRVIGRLVDAGLLVTKGGTVAASPTSA